MASPGGVRIEVEGSGGDPCLKEGFADSSQATGGLGVHPLRYGWTRRDVIQAVGVGVIAPMVHGSSNLHPTSARRSTPGVYEGFSPAVADGFSRRSRYVSVSDGCRIAVDILLPTREGEALKEPLPAVALFTGYRRAWVMGTAEVPAIRHWFSGYSAGDFVCFGLLRAKLPDRRHATWPEGARGLAPKELAEWLLASGGSPVEYLLVHGYVVVMADTRATGASFGLVEQQKPMRLGRDVADVLAALATESWSNGSFGMLGFSWLGVMQHLAVTYGAQHLKAVMPQVAPYDEYLNLWPGGIFNAGMMREWLDFYTREDEIAPAYPVDEDADGRLRDEAVRSRKSGGPAQSAADSTLAIFEASKSRDEFEAEQSLTGQTFADGSTGNLTFEPLDFAHANRGGIPVYEVSGWWDIYSSEPPVSVANLTAPRKLLMGPWHHGNTWVPVEALRWFDYWLKGIDNGIMREPRVTYGIARTTDGPLWATASEWPPADSKQNVLFFAPGGKLLSNAGRSEKLHLMVDKATTVGPDARGPGSLHADFLDYHGLAANTAGQLRFEAAALTHSLDICGFPILEVDVAASDTAAQFFAYLLAINRGEDAIVLSEGQLDLRYHSEQTAPIDVLGQPYRTFRSSTRQPLTPWRAVRVRVGMTPIAWHMSSGDRLAVALMGADAVNAPQPEGSLARELVFGIGGEAPSKVTIPVMRSPRLLKGAFERLPVRSQQAVRAFKWA